MPYMIISRSVTDGISLSVSKSKLVFSSLILADNKLTLICLLTSQQLVTVSVRHTQITVYFTYPASSASLRTKV